MLRLYHPEPCPSERDTFGFLRSAPIRVNPRYASPGYFFISAVQFTTRVRGVAVSSGM